MNANKPSQSSAILPLLLLAAQARGEPFHLIRSEEATIADIHAALRSKELTCRQLVQMLPRSDRGVRQEGSDAQRDHHGQP